MRQQDRDHGGSAEGQDSIWAVVPVALIAMLVAAIGTVALLNSLSFGPAVGDLVVFTPVHGAAGDAALQPAEITAERAGAAAGRGDCVLSPAAMAREGGSLVVEREESRSGKFLVHWAGPRTSVGPGDCGRVADLLIAASDLLDLAGAAGGFGIGHTAMMSASALGGVPNMLE